ncbi:MAG: helix-turn-helix transcriptional regulator [Anaerolineae bacterium]|jgi:hypothetical protein|nr:helix-turn-helix transcriptional regulator [Anaerolineae bacterium]MBT7776021.1 helix-turn-helix transcriptional regulator [Anaerolineae bacterium]
MSRPLIPPTKVCIPSDIVFSRTISSPIRDIYIQLRGLAYGRTETPPVSFSQLSNITGKSVSTIYGHMAVLRDRGALRWRTAQDSTIIVSFPKKNIAFFTNPLDSDFLESSKEEEDLLQTKILKSVKPPPNFSADKKKTSLQNETKKILLAEGVFKSKLEEIARSELSDKDISAIVHWVKSEYPNEQKPGLIIYRITKCIHAPDSYYAKPCSECGFIGSHTPSCGTARRKKYACPYCGEAPCVCEDEGEDKEEEDE